MLEDDIVSYFSLSRVVGVKKVSSKYNQTESERTMSRRLMRPTRKQQIVPFKAIDPNA